MSQVKRSLVSATGVVAAAFALLGGNVWRNRVEKAPGETPSFTVNGLVASKEFDLDLSEVDFFHEMTKLLKREYVDPITDDQKLAAGAVRGMIGSLGDPKSLYYDKEEYRVFNAARQGRYEGIGAELALQLDAPTGPSNRAGILPSPGEDDGSRSPERPIGVPELVVSAVIPGGPADKAGVKVGDRVSYVDGHFLVDKDSIMEFRAAQLRFRGVQDGFTAGKVSNDEFKAEVEKYRGLHKAFRLKFENSILPLRARDKLTAGVGDTVDIVWRRGKETRETHLTKANVSAQTFSARGDVIGALYFAPGAAGRLGDAIAGRSSVTVDLRNNVDGDFQEMRKCLAVLAPTGQYGFVANDRERKPQPIAISKGNPHPPKITFLVDNSTAGAAAILAQALKDKGLAKLLGKTSSDLTSIEVFSLPDGSGYSLVNGWYAANLPKSKHASSTEQPRLVASLERSGGQK